MQTISETIEHLHGALRDYIEATYHISSAHLIAQRKELLERDGVIHRIPYLESTPRYRSGAAFASMSGLPGAALEAFSRLAKPEGPLPRLIYDPPYKHQADAIRGSLIDGKNLVIMTGTGSGKTESFLLPILGKLAREAERSPAVFAQQAAMRALLLYPMNALVNDQLGRLRSLFGDPRLSELFKGWAGRPPRFARYTSRTPYAGVRTSKRDSRKLQSFDDFYADIQRGAAEGDQEKAELLRALKERGKWPAKPDLAAWLGVKGADWQDRKTGEFIRAVTLPDDTELLTRHEVQLAPPDLLVTNYSMLEYMLMRPIERPIFDQTRAWLEANPDESFLVVLDEAHLYRGAAGAEVGLLLRRLRDRLGLPVERFRIICATASFEESGYAPEFGAQLAGVSKDTFTPITGEFAWREAAAPGSNADAALLSSIELTAFYEATSEADRILAVQPLLDYRGVSASATAEASLHSALSDFAPMGQLVNATMSQAVPIGELGSRIFSDADAAIADMAITVLMALGSVARPGPDQPGLLPCRVHNFFRGLPGLWVCMDPECSELPEAERSGICGKMFSQPQEGGCGCGARVLEFYTCRNCGTAYARAYTDDVDSPSALWAEPGQSIRLAGAHAEPLLPIDLLLEEPAHDELAEEFDYDLETGRLNPLALGPRNRRVYVRRGRLSEAVVEEDEESASSFEARGLFTPCGVCGKTDRFGRSYVQDHQTKGDQPFQALLARQIQIQPPGPKGATRFAPLRGRKVLAFSDSRQVAARLAPNLQMYSERDSLRPLIISGFKWLREQETIRQHLNLDDLYFGVLLASKRLNVRLRPEMRAHENFEAEEIVAAVSDADLADPAALLSLVLEIRAHRPPESLLDSMLTTLTDRFWGMEALALATLKEADRHTNKLLALPPIPGLAESDPEKLALSRFWLSCWANNGFWLAQMPGAWVNRPRSEGFRIRPRNPKSKLNAINAVIPDKVNRKLFWDSWSLDLMKWFTKAVESGHRCLNGSELSLEFEGEWVHCSRCKSVYRPVPSVGHCVNCGSDQVGLLDPDNDLVFLARKGFYRKPVTEAVAEARQPMALIAAEHTAQLNAPQNEDVFSRAEENELLFQDINLGRQAVRATAIDVLSSTTTMEVGIDLGALSGVALRNMPPGRANYQQRAGRAGRRGNAIATVVAFGSSDSHDEHYFSEPDGMIRGKVVDPKLTLDNKDITCRHIRAFLLQNYHQDRLPEVDPEQDHNLFSVLGTVADFRNGTSVLNRDDFAHWLAEHEHELRARVASWVPKELSPDDREELLENMTSDCLGAVDEAIRPVADTSEADDEDGETPPEEGDENPAPVSNSGKLLDRLLYCGKLPRYAFPTDVATFQIFDRDRSSKHRPIMRFAPSQGLPIALTQYAPGKQVWVAGKCYTSGAIYSVMDDRFEAWENKRVYLECSECGFANAFSLGEAERGETRNCPACGADEAFGPARYWLRPPGFAHPVDLEEVTSPDDVPETSYATRAKLTMGTPDEQAGWFGVNERIRALRTRQHLLVSNTGPRKEGYTYCTKCGRIEASTESSPKLLGPHPKPYPDDDDARVCEGISPTRHIVLGTDFITDVCLISLRVAPPLSLRPGHSSTIIALRTLSEALAKAASQMLEIEPGELMAEFRPALAPGSNKDLEAEIFLYDTLPGGAGFSAQLADRGEELFERALHLLKSCPEDCDASCYRCLRSFKNKFEHSQLDRHVASELVEFLLTGTHSEFNPVRLHDSTELFYRDLTRQSDGRAQFTRDAPIMWGGKKLTIPILVTGPGGKKFAIALTGPLTSGRPADPALGGLLESGTDLTVLLENELVIRGSLATATRRVLHTIFA